MSSTSSPLALASSSGQFFIRASSTPMIMPGGYVRMLISWMTLIFRKATSQSYKTFLVLWKLFRRRQVISCEKARDFRECRLALSSQPTELTASVTLAALPLPPQSIVSQPGRSGQFATAEPVDESSSVEPANAQASQNLAASSISMPVPCHYPPPPQPTAPEQLTSLIPIMPTDIKRYDRNVTIKEVNAFKLEKGPLDCSVEDAAVYPWEPLTHPEGALFFYHPHKRLFTDANVRILRIADKVDSAAEQAYEAARNEQISLHSSVELALEFQEDNMSLGYYFVDHEKRIIFWFEDHKAAALVGNVRGVESKSHVRYALESQYWKHIELFPNKRSLPIGVVVKLNEIVMHAQAENITSDSCLAPFGPDEIASMLTLMDPLMNSVNNEREHSVWIVARFMRLFCHAKFVNFCGQPGARLEADQSLYGGPKVHPKHTILRFMNIILFGSPDAHSKSIHRIWVDETMVQPRWKNFINRLNTEWNGYTIFSTVMLAVDISFLAVPSVQNQTAAILVAYLSTLCAMGSLMISLILSGQVNDARRDNAEEVAHFMGQMTQSLLGLESLALMLSLPFALLIWAMTFFGTALSIVIFKTSGIVTISIVSPILFVIVILATWPVLAANDIHPTAFRAWIVDRMLEEPRNVISEV